MCKKCPLIVSFLQKKSSFSFPSPQPPTPPPTTGGREKGGKNWNFAARKLTINKHFLHSSPTKSITKNTISIKSIFKKKKYKIEYAEKIFRPM